MNKKKFTFFLIFIFSLSIFLSFCSGNENNSERENKEESRLDLNRENKEESRLDLNEDYPRYDHSAIFYTWIGTLYFLLLSFIFGSYLTYIIFIFFLNNSFRENSNFVKVLLTTCCLAFLFYSFIFPAFIAFGNYKNWVRFYSPLNITVMVLLLFIIVALLYLKNKY